jgi:dTDP-4-dehydrorhamnose reductase
MIAWPPGSPVLVTGASGFFGEHLCRRLAASGVPVVGTWHTHAVSIPGAEIVRVDLTDPAAVGRLVRNLSPAAIVHAAAMTQTAACEQHPEAAHAAIVGATTALCAAAARHVPRAPLIALSTDLVFDGREAPYSPAAPPKPLMAYGSLKWAAEQPVLGLPTGCVVRSALMYGAPATHKASFLGWMRSALEAGERLTLFEDEWRTPVFVGDLCRALEGLLRRRATGVWHGGGPERLNRLQMGQAVCRVWGYEEGLLAPARLADSPTPAARPADVSMDSAATWAATGVEPRTFEAGLRETKAEIEATNTP